MKDRATPDQRINPPTDGNAIHELHFKIVFHARRKVSEQEEQLIAIKLYKDKKYISPKDLPMLSHQCVTDLGCEGVRIEGFI